MTTLPPAAGRGRSPWRPALLVCGLVAIALHLLLLVAWPVGPGGAAVQVSTQVVQPSMQVLNLRPTLPTLVEPAKAIEPAAARPAARLPIPAASVPAPSAVPAPATTAAVAATASLAVEPAWWPREQLELGPQPLRPVLVDTAQAGTGLLPAGSNALLYIDEQGRVQQVEFGGTTLSTEAEQTLRTAFEVTPFSPGWRGGQPVRAKVRVALDLVVDMQPGPR